MQTILVVETAGVGLIEITSRAAEFVVGHGDGLLTAFVRHTSCSLLIQENADPSVQADLVTFFGNLAPPADSPNMSWMTHTLEGADDMPAHIKAALLPTSIGIPVRDGKMVLGQWQGLYLVEHRIRPHRREVFLQFG